MVVNGRQPFSGTLQKVAIRAIRGKPSFRFKFEASVRLVLGVTAQATGESSEFSIVKSVQNVDKSEDRVALIGLGFADVVAFWASTNLISAIDKLPIIPGALELIGILFSSVSIMVFCHLCNCLLE
ncbi:hypothetical protein Pfo_012108 [Paulownia fortunei]|nr:hypothetical protein Pfo_012108 [Paulownia fortunei]